MMQRHCFLLAVLTAILSMSGRAPGQPAAPAPAAAATPSPKIDMDVRKELKLTAELTPANINEIKVHFAQAEKVMSLPGGLKVWREAIVNAATPPAPRELSRAYADALAEQVNGDMLRIYAAARPQVKLNIAIIVEKTAETTKSAKLEPIIGTILQDKDPSARIWGPRAARWIMPDLVRVRAHTQLLNLVLAVIAKEPRLTGAVVEGVYACLTPENPNAGAVQVVMAPLLDLTKKRLAHYQAGTVDEPGLDDLPFVFLCQPVVIGGLKPQERVEVIQLAVDLLSSAAILADKNPKVRQDIGEMAFRVLQGLAVAGKALNWTNGGNAALRASFPAKNANLKLVDVIWPVFQELATETDLKGLKVPTKP